jgi:hypothetical protein
MTRVEYRFAAARYFLQLLHSKKPKPPEFDWLIEAVISTARSATWLMNAEARNNSAALEEWKASNPGDAETARAIQKHHRHTQSNLKRRASAYTDSLKGPLESAARIDGGDSGRGPASRVGVSGWQETHFRIDGWASSS